MTASTPLLTLLGHLAAASLGAQPPDRAVRVSDVQVHAVGLTLLVQVRMPGGLGPFTRRVEVTVEASDAERTVLRWEVQGAEGLGRMLHRGAGLLPPQVLEALARRLLGEGVHLEGAHLVLRHREWLDGLRRRHRDGD